MKPNLQDKKMIDKVFNEIIDTYNSDDVEYMYLMSMNENEKHALVVSKIILESSFSVEKSIGFLESEFNKKN